MGIKKQIKMGIKKQIKISAGIAILYKKSLLVIHPTNASWQKKTLGIPKGIVEGDNSDLENLKKNACREVKEEIGVDISFKKLNIFSYLPIYQKRSEGKIIEKEVYAFIYRASGEENWINNFPFIDKEKLQKEEVDWAKFLNYKELINNILPYQQELLELIK